MKLRKKLAFGLKVIVLSSLLISCSNTLSGDGSSPESGDSDGASHRAYFFKAVGGEHYYITPYIGIRQYDNTSYTYVFKRGCEDAKDSAIASLAKTNSGGPVGKVGGIGQFNAKCSYEANIIFENNTLKVTGKYLKTENGLDIIMVPVSKDEFFKGLKSESTDKGFNYLISPRDEREDYDDACKELANSSCEPLLGK